MAPSTTTEPDLRALRVLVVDDEADIRLGLRRLLATLGIEAREAASGGLALERLDEQVADLVITDLMMPGISGVELLHAVCDQPAKRKLCGLKAGNGNYHACFGYSISYATLQKPFPACANCRDILFDSLDAEILHS